VKFGREERTLLPAKFHLDRRNVSPLSENRNIGPAMRINVVLFAVLPVTKKQNKESEKHQTLSSHTDMRRSISISTKLSTILEELAYQLAHTDFFGCHR